MKKILVIAGILLTLSAAGAQAQQRQEPVADPWEGFNRAMFQVNNTLDHTLLKPAAMAYRGVIPRPMRDSVRNLIDYLGEPINLINNLLQGDTRRAGDTVTRFAINSTFGIAGLFDAGKDFGYPKHEEDFGQTLGVWGVHEGPYLVLPLFGPSNARDLWGRIGDLAMNPITYVVAKNDDLEGYAFGLTALNAVDAKARNMDELARLEETSLDYYATIRSLYTQSRKARIENRRGASSSNSFDDLDFEY